MVDVSAGMAPDSEPVPPVVAPVSLFGGLHAASPRAVMAANRNVDERFMVSLPWAAPRGTTVEVNYPPVPAPGPSREAKPDRAGRT